MPRTRLPPPSGANLDKMVEGVRKVEIPAAVVAHYRIDAAFVAIGDFVIRLEDFRARFGPGAGAGAGAIGR